ncbi:hypothetical protein NN561_017405 [Cricetulus griseus]
MELSSLQPRRDIPPEGCRAGPPVHHLARGRAGPEASGRPSAAAPGLLNLPALGSAWPGGRRQTKSALPAENRAAAPSTRLPPKQPEANGLSSLTCPRGGACCGD